MSAPNLRKGTSICLCSCGCNRRVSRQTAWRHSKRVQPESSRPPKRRRIAHFQPESPIITPDKQRRSRTDNISSSSHSRVDASDHPQLHAPSLDEFNPSLPLLDPPASNLFQPQGDALTEASSVFIDDFLRSLLTRTHQSDDEGSEGAFEGDAAEAADVDHDTGNSKNGEGVTVEGDADPREGVVSDWDLLAEEFIVEAEELDESSISDYDLDILRPFGMKIRNNLTASTFHEMSYNFSKAGMENLAKTRSHVRALSRFEPVIFACCINSCICYAGPYADLDKCPKCETSRLNESGRARRTFSYMPLIPRLRALMSNRTYATRLQYRADEHPKTGRPGTTTDIFDGLHYRSLLKERVVVGDRTYPHNYFSDHRDVALGFATDGFAPFKKRKHTAWILLVFNYNLPPEQRFQKDNILCVGIIPGPKKPWNADSFIYPLVRELLELAIGVSAYDALSRSLFALRAYVIAGFGDIPAVSMLMHMKGHNGLCPCRMCSILAIRIPDSRNKTLYVPLSRRNHPTPTDVVEYHPENLPLRSHEHFMAQAKEVESAPSETQREELAKAYGIKGIPLLSALGSLRFPQSFPYDFMHLIWENLIPNLVLFWSGRYKGMDEGQPYVLSPSIWQAAGATSTAATKTIPSSFGSSIPNPATDCSSFTSSTWSVWSLFIAPTVLRGRFPEDRYFVHFCSLVRILNLCLQFEISEEEIGEIELGIREWVVNYERLYYQHNPERLPACPLTIHALLHIPDQIRWMGPCWTTWAFPIERQCGYFQRSIRSRRNPYVSMDRHLIELSQLRQIKILYNLTDEQLGKPPEYLSSQTKRLEDYPQYELVAPKRVGPLNDTIRKVLANGLATRFCVRPKVAKKFIPDDVEQWGKLRRLEGGDIMHAHDLVPKRMDSRDASFVRYEQLVDRNQRHQNLPEKLEFQTFFGQLQSIVVISIPISNELKTKEPQVVCLAVIRQVHATFPNAQGMPPIPFYSQSGALDPADIKSIQCVVGRVEDRGKWGLVDRSGPLAHAVFSEVDQPGRHD